MIQNLTDNEKQNLSTLPGSKGYEALLKIMNEVIANAESEHFAAYKDRDLFDRTGLIAVSMRAFLEEVKQEINSQVEIFRATAQAKAIERQALQNLEKPTFQSVAQSLY